MKRHFYLFFGSALLLLQACATYHTKHARFHEHFLASEWEEAEKILEKDKNTEKSKNKLLYYFDSGLINHLRGKYQASNHFFEQAYLTQENFTAQPLDEAFALLTNPTAVEYKGEVHELLLLHYYKALNYLQLGQPEAALVECRRLHIKLNQLSDQHAENGLYKRDAFIHAFIGLVYQANHDYNNAFIAYRNAIEIYQEDYQTLFGMQVPTQLKKDLIYTAYKAGFYGQVAHYNRLFKLVYNPAQEPEAGDLVFLWNNGIGPIKTEQHFDIILEKRYNGTILFKNKDLGLSIPFPGLTDRNSASLLANVKLLRVAFPVYQERSLLYDRATVTTKHCGKQPLEMLENINAVSLQVLRQRMVAVWSKILLKLALKQALAHQLQQKNPLLGVAFSGFNFITEKADTRNWQTLPHSIYYTRIRLPEGNHSISFKTSSSQCEVEQTQEVNVDVQPGKTAFEVINSPHTLAPPK